MQTNPIVVIDIETIPAQRQDIADYIAATIKPPATIKLAASIAKWHAESKQEEIDEAIGKTGLDGAFGQVCVVGFQLTEDSPALAVYSPDDEAFVLNQFNAELDEIPRRLWSATTLVGHNVLNFDLRFLLQRYMVNNIRPHAIINVAAQAKAWDGKVYDTMTQFAGYGNRISLDKLCMALGVPSPKSEMDGSMVGQYVADGYIDEVVAYCKKDVLATRAVYQRMTFATAVNQLQLAA